jgi:hypothetical protein
MIHRDFFFDAMRHYLTDGSLKENDEYSQVSGSNLLLDWFDDENPPIPAAHHLSDREMAYCLATAWHETAFTMRPVIEYGGESYLKSKPYYPWYGRGYVQLTWEENYQKQDAKLGLKGALMKTPDLALDPVIATRILLLGMADGDFTGKRLGDYFTADLTDWYNARRIVNGTDKASAIAAYAEKFCHAITHI